MAKWYVLSVVTGREIEVKNRLEQMGIKTLVPLLEKVLRQKGSWRRVINTVFTGYVFIKCDYTWNLYYKINSIGGIMRILGGGKDPTPLTDEEIMTVRRIDMLRNASEVTFDNEGRIQPLNGILKEFKDRIISINRRQRRAKIKLRIAKTDTIVTVSFLEQGQMQSKAKG